MLTQVVIATHTISLPLLTVPMGFTLICSLSVQPLIHSVNKLLLNVHVCLGGRYS